MKKPDRLSLFERPRAVAAKMENRPRSQAEYHTSRWTKASKAFWQRNPLCKLCQDEGIIKASAVTDHIIPPEIYGDFWNQSNWQALCQRHNIVKGNQDKKLIQHYRNGQRKTD